MSTVPANVQNQNQGMIEKPSYIQALPEESNADLRQFMSPPRLKVVQDQSADMRKQGFKPGDILLLPSLVKIADMETEFTFATLHVFPTWICTNPWELKTTLPFIRERSDDPNSVIAKKAKAFTEEKCPEDPKYLIKYKEVQNHMIRVTAPTDVELPELPIVMPLYSGEYNSGRILVQLIDSRRSPRYVCQFNGIAKFRPGKGKGTWYGIDFRNSPSPWVAENLVNQFKEESEHIRNLVASGGIQVDLNDAAETDAAGGEAANEKKF